MRDLLRADAYRMYRTKGFRLCALFMLLSASAFVVIQRTAMDYAVSLDRVLFLPMALYGVAVAALIGVFVGSDFADGGVRNKIIAGAARKSVYYSGLVVSACGAATVYLLTLVFTTCLGSALFADNVTAGKIAGYAALGLFTCLAYVSIFYFLSVLSGGRNTAVVVCVLLSFCLLFLCLHTNQILAQDAYAGGVPNPAYVDGVKRTVYLILHDLNPSGQAAQLAAMQCLDPVRFIATDLMWVVVSVCVGAPLFQKMDVR